MFGVTAYTDEVNVDRAAATRPNGSEFTLEKLGLVVKQIFAEQFLIGSRLGGLLPLPRLMPKAAVANHPGQWNGK